MRALIEKKSNAENVTDAPTAQFGTCSHNPFPTEGVDEKTAGDFAHLLQALSAVDFGVMRAAVRRPLPPTVIAYARDDHMIETEVAEELAAAVPGARVLAFDEGGHNIQKTRAVELGAAIRALGA